MKCFFAIEPDLPTRLKIESWREKYLPPFASPVPLVNFHLTVAFLGQITESQLDVLTQTLDSATMPNKFKLDLDYQGYWAKPKAFWLGCENIPAELLKLVQLSEHSARIAKINLQQRPYIPHLTLARKCSIEPPAALVEPQFSSPISELALYESISTNSGVRYPKRLSWPLLPKFG